MTRATETVNRVVKALETRGYKVNIRVVKGYSSESYIYEVYNEARNKKIKLYETYRHNGTKENVTAMLEVWRLIYHGTEQKQLYKSKIPYEASSRVINNRIDKALEKFLYNGLAPAQEGLDLFFKVTQ